MFCCSASIALGDGVVFVFFLRFIAASNLSAWFLDEERARVPLGGGGGGNAV